MKCGFIQELRPAFNVQSDLIRTRFLIRFLIFIFIFNLVIVISLRLFFLFVCSYCPFTLPKKFYTSYTRTFIFIVTFLSFKWKWPKFGQNVVSHCSILLPYRMVRLKGFYLMVYNSFHFMANGKSFCGSTSWLCFLTHTSDSISRISRMASTIKWSFGVAAVSVRVAVVSGGQTLFNVLEKEGWYDKIWKEVKKTSIKLLISELYLSSACDIS